MIEPKLYPYNVVLTEDPKIGYQIVFECQAETAAHAKEQARNAYPGSRLVSCHRSRGLPLRYLIFSRGEHAAGEGGFWDNRQGWNAHQASLFSHTDKQEMHLPMSVGNDATWVAC